MTHNQINYWNLQETKRSNLANETETNRHNVATETETNRHNVTTESIDLGKLNETVRSNKANEDIKYRTLAETHRSNLARENIDLGNLGVAEATQAEQVRHNMETEDISYGYNTGYLDEWQRHNKETESQSRDQTDAEVQYKGAQTDYVNTQNELAEIQKTWESLQRSANLEISQANIRKINSEILRLQQDLDLYDQRNKRDWLKLGADEIINWRNSTSNKLGALSKLVDALIPG